MGLSMGVRFAVIFAVLTAAGGGSGATAAASGDRPAARVQMAQVYPAIPKPSVRRTGELEDWSDSGKTPAKAAPGKKPAGAAAKAQPKPAAEKAARDPDDGGLPLPRSKTIDNSAPVGMDSKGNIGTTLKF